MSTRIAAVAALFLAPLLASCGGGSDGSGLVSRPQYRDVVVITGVGGHEDVRYNPIGTLYVESVGREVFVLERATLGTVVVQHPAGLSTGGNQINLGEAAQVAQIRILTDGNVLFLSAGASGGQVTILGNDNTIYAEPGASLTVDDQGSGNTVVGL